MPLPPQSPKLEATAPVPSGSAGTGVPRPAPKPPVRPASAPSGEAFSGLRVSLMPTEGSERQADLSRRLMVLALVFVLETLIIGGVYFLLQRQTSARTREVASLAAQRDLIAEVYKDNAAKIAEAVKFTKQVEIVGKRLDAHLYWTSLFDFLALHTRPGVAFINFSGDAGTGVLSLEAVGRSYRDLAEQIVLFRRNPAVLDARTTAAATKVAADGTVEGVSFTVFLSLKPDVWRGMKTAPDAPAGTSAAPR